MNNKPLTHKADLFVALYIFCIVAAELLGSKSFPIMEINGYKLSGAVGMLLFPFIYSINDIMFEVFGKDRARNLAKLSVLIVFLLILFSYLAVSLPSTTRFAPLNDSYNAIFTQSIRISIASLVALGVSNIMDVVVFAKLKVKFKTTGLWLRNNLSNISSLLIDTVVFMFVAFYAIDQSFSSNLTFLIGLILPYWLLKSLVSAFGTPLVYWGVKWLKKSE
jgi:uncharacterized integral membrane protein (TIGR00697 family)